MSSLILPSRRIVQPAGAVEIDARIRSVILPTVTSDLARNRWVSLQSQVGSTIGPAGRAWRGLDTYSTQITSGGGGSGVGLYVGNTKPVVVGCVFSLNQLGINQSLFSDMNTTGWDSLQLVIKNDNAIQFGVRDSGTAGSSVTYSFSPVIGRIYYSVVAHLPGVGQYLFLDGRLVASKTTWAANTSNRYDSTGDPSWLCLGSYPSVYNSTASLFLGFIAASGDLSYAQNLSANPWQIFKPVTRRIYFDVGAASGLSVNATQATADASGNTATVDRQLAITASQAAASASGYAAGISFGLTVSATQATADASGYLAGIDRHLDVVATTGTASASGYDASIQFGSDLSIAASYGLASADGYQAAINLQAAINAMAATASASGYDAAIVSGGLSLTAADLAAIDALIVARVSDIAAATLAAAAAAGGIHSDIRKFNNTSVKGDGTSSNKFRSTLVA